MSIFRVVTGTIISAVAIVVFSVFYPLLYIDNQFKGLSLSRHIKESQYDNDVQLLFQTAQQLGYTEENELNFFRSQGSTTSNHDSTTLVFSTTDAPDTFAEKVDMLGLTHSTSTGAVYRKEFIRTTYVTLINDGYSRTLFPADSSTDYNASILSEDMAPRVTKWHFLLSREKDIRLRIEFARLPNKDLFWKDTLHQKNIAGPIVVMEMNR